ncbi:MAG: flavoprotein [Patescibacteria group bacterium]
MKNKKILVGITGGVAAYKTCSLVNMFLKEGADVKVIMTHGATKFVTPLTFQSLTNHPVYVDIWQTYNKEEKEVSRKVYNIPLWKKIKKQNYGL